MKQLSILLSAVLVTVLVSGCVLTEDEIDQAHAYMNAFTDEMSKTDQYMNAHQWAEAQQAFNSADGILTKIDGLVVTAEERGADPEKIRRIKAGSAILHELFDYTVSLTDYFQEVEAVRDKLDAEKGTMPYDEAVSLINTVISKSNDMEVETNTMLASLDKYAEDFPEDYAETKLSEGRGNIQNALSAIQEVRSNSEAGLR